MSDSIFLWVSFWLCLAVTVLSLIGAFTTSSVLLIFAAVFAPATALMGRELWERR
jgi:hypothetical protein